MTKRTETQNRRASAVEGASEQTVNQVSAIVALVLIMIVFVLLSQGVINGLVAIGLTLAIGFGTSTLRNRWGKRLRKRK